ncbi:uncharacterized protein LOC120702190 [Panicum virgatum]|nr:uncharacterized protein LOC120702190 [Panicum virgatum]
MVPCFRRQKSSGEIYSKPWDVRQLISFTSSRVRLFLSSHPPISFSRTPLPHGAQLGRSTPGRGRGEGAIHQRVLRGIAGSGPLRARASNLARAAWNRWIRPPPRARIEPCCSPSAIHSEAPPLCSSIRAWRIEISDISPKFSVTFLQRQEGRSGNKAAHKHLTLRSTDNIGFDGVDDRETLGASNNSAQKFTHACYFSKSPVYSKFLGLNRRSVWFFFCIWMKRVPLGDLLMLLQT